MKQITVFSILALILTLCGCHSQYAVQRAAEEPSQTSTVVFVRPAEYSPLFGTKSLRDYVEVVYEQAKRNDSGRLQVSIGLRNRGGQHIYDTNGRDVIHLSARVVFYASELANRQQAPVYESGWESVVIERGNTRDFTVVSPSKEARYYQVILSEAVK